MSNALVHNCGYAGGVGAVLTFAAAYGIDLDDLAVKIEANAPAYIWKEAAEFYDRLAKKKGNTYGLSYKVFVACDALKRAWRYSNPAISAYWKELDNGIRGAIANPGKEFKMRKLSALREGNWLRIRLPSGRFLSYASPRVEDKNITYMGMDQYTRKWQRIRSHGPKFLENACQSIGRDVLLEGLVAAEANGYEVILTVHDEIVAEAPDAPEYNADMLSALMSRELPWTKGLPLAAAGFEAYRYRKG